MFASKSLALSLACSALVTPFAAVVFCPSSHAQTPAATAGATTIDAADIERVLALRTQGKSAEAIALLDAHAATKNLNDRAVALRGLARFDSGAVQDEDVARFRSYVGEDPYVLLLLGHVYAAPSPYQNPKLAAVCYQRAAVGLPDSLERQFGLARAKALLEPTAANADAVLAFAARKDALPAGLYERFAAHAAIVCASALAMKGDRGDATLRLFRSARELAPNDPDPLRGEALTLAIQGKGDQAAPLLDDLQHRFPECMADVFYTRAVIAQLAGKPAEAIEAATNAFSLKADYVAALELAAQLHYEAGKLDEVRPLLERARRYANPSERARMLFARYFLDRAQQIPTTKSDGMDDKAFAAEQNKRRELLRQAAEESLALRAEKPYVVENLELLLKICSTVGAELDPLAKELTLQLDYAKKRAAKG